MAANIGEHVFQCHLGWVQAPKPYGQNGKRRLQELLDQGYLCYIVLVGLVQVLYMGPQLGGIHSMAYKRSGES